MSHGVYHSTVLRSEELNFLEAFLDDYQFVDVSMLISVKFRIQAQEND